MIGLDTNVLLRLLLRDNPQQAVVAESFALNQLTESNPGFVNVIVMAELSWVLEQQLRLSREEVVDIFSRLLTIRQLAIQYPEEIETVLDHYRNSSVGLADLMIAVVNQAHGCSTTISFDRRLSRAGFATLLEHD